MLIVQKLCCAAEMNNISAMRSLTQVITELVETGQVRPEDEDRVRREYEDRKVLIDEALALLKDPTNVHWYEWVVLCAIVTLPV